MALPKTNMQEKLSNSYFNAVISHAGYTASGNDSGNDFGIDYTVFHVEETEDDGFVGTGAVLNVQLKSTYDFQIRDEKIVWSIKGKAYNRLLRPSFQPRVLILYIMPREHSGWVNVCHDNLTMQHCAYYMLASELDQTKINENSSKTIYIPKTNLFDVSAVHSLVAPGLAKIGLHE